MDTGGAEAHYSADGFGRGTVRALVEAVGGLAWTEARLFEVVGGWIATTEDDALTVLFSRVSRELGEHAGWWESILPDAVLLEPDAAVRAPSEEMARLPEVLGGLAGDAGRAAALFRVVLPAVASRCRAVPAGERFVRRVRDRILADLLDAVVDGAAVTARVARGQADRVGAAESAAGEVLHPGDSA